MGGQNSKKFICKSVVWKEENTIPVAEIMLHCRFRFPEAWTDEVKWDRRKRSSSRDTEVDLGRFWKGKVEQLQVLSTPLPASDVPRIWEQIASAGRQDTPNSSLVSTAAFKRKGTRKCPVKVVGRWGTSVATQLTRPLVYQREGQMYLWGCSSGRHPEITGSCLSQAIILQILDSLTKSTAGQQEERLFHGQSV